MAACDKIPEMCRRKLNDSKSCCANLIKFYSMASTTISFESNSQRNLPFWYSEIQKMKGNKMNDSKCNEI